MPASRPMTRPHWPRGHNPPPPGARNPGTSRPQHPSPGPARRIRSTAWTRHHRSCRWRAAVVIRVTTPKRSSLTRPCGCWPPVTQAVNDQHQIGPLLERVQVLLAGLNQSEQLLADTGYFSPDHVAAWTTTRACGPWCVWRGISSAWRSCDRNKEKPTARGALARTASPLRNK